MPAWWGKKSSKNKGVQQQQQQQVIYNNPVGTHLNLSKSSISNDNTKGKDKDKEKPTSFDELFLRNSPRTSKDFGGSSGFSGLDSYGAGRVSHPLPLPSTSSVNDHIPGSTLGSGSVSSVSSDGSSEDQPVAQENGQFGNFRGQGDTKFIMRSRSPGPGSRGPTSPTSPLHPRLCALNLESPTGKQEDGKSQSHRLPLPPGSPTSPSALPNTRTSGSIEFTISTKSQWKKGKLLGRGTFGHVYLGFNR